MYYDNENMRYNSVEAMEHRENERKKEERERERIGNREYERRQREHYARVARHEREMHNFFFG